MEQVSLLGPATRPRFVVLAAWSPTAELFLEQNQASNRITVLAGALLDAQHEVFAPSNQRAGDHWLRSH